MLAWIPLFWDEMLVLDAVRRIKRGEISQEDFRELIYQVNKRKYEAAPLRREPQQTNPRRPVKPSTAKEWYRLLVRAQLHVRGTRWAADLNPDWLYDVDQLKEAAEFIQNAATAGYVLSDRTLRLIDKKLNERLARGPGRDRQHYGARWGLRERYAIRIVKQTCRWWRGPYKARPRQANHDALRRELGMTKLEFTVTCLRWGAVEYDAGRGWNSLGYNVPICPRCGGNQPTRIKTRHLWKCQACQFQFNVWTGTPFQGSRLEDKVIIDALCLWRSVYDALQTLKDRYNTLLGADPFGLLTVDEKLLEMTANPPDVSLKALRQLGMSKFQARRVQQILRKPDAFMHRLGAWFYEGTDSDYASVLKQKTARRRIQALRRLAERPGTQAEGVVAQQILNREVNKLNMPSV